MIICHSQEMSMPHAVVDEETHKRFFILAGLVRHEFWLHHQDPDNYAFAADPNTLTLTARRQHDHEMPCTLAVTPEALMGDLDVLARQFFKEHCQGSGLLDERRRPRAPTRSGSLR
jgi:hypothetical protein